MSQEFNPVKFIEVALTAPSHQLYKNLTEYLNESGQGDFPVDLVLQLLLETPQGPEEASTKPIIALENTTPQTVYEICRLLLALGQPPAVVLSTLIETLSAPHKNDLIPPNELLVDLQHFSKEEAQALSQDLVKLIQQKIVEFNRAHPDNPILAIVETGPLAAGVATPGSIFNLRLIFSQPPISKIYRGEIAIDTKDSIEFRDTIDKPPILVQNSLAVHLWPAHDIEVDPDDPIAAARGVLRDFHMVGPAIIISERSKPLIIHPGESLAE